MTKRLTYAAWRAMKRAEIEHGNPETAAWVKEKLRDLAYREAHEDYYGEPPR